MASISRDSDGKEISLLLLGKTGHGKSATGNTILGLEAFGYSDLAASKTITSSLNCVVREDGTKVRIVDSPGVMDTEKPDESIIAEIMDGMSLCPNGFHALLFVIKFGIRYTIEERESLETLKKYFGSDFLKDFGIIVMTQGDSFDLNHEEDHLTFNDWLMANKCKEQAGPFDELLNECGNRIVLFYNSGEEYLDERKKGVEKLFELVEQIPHVYTSQHIELAKKARDEIVKQLDAPVMYTDIQEKLSLLRAQIAKDLRNDTFSYKFMLKKIETVNDEVKIVGENHKDSLGFVLFKEKLDSVLPRVEFIKNITERGKQRKEQERLLKDIEILSEPPTTKQIFMKKAFSTFAKILAPIATVLTFGTMLTALKTWKQKMAEAHTKIKALYDFQTSK